MIFSKRAMTKMFECAKTQKQGHMRILVGAVRAVVFPARSGAYHY